MATSPPIIDGGVIVDPGPFDPGDFPNRPVTTVLDDIADAVNAYPATYVDILFVDVEPASGDHINANEEAEFKLRILNRGPMTMRDVEIKLVGKHGTQVKTSAMPSFEDEAIHVVNPTIAGENGAGLETAVLHLKAGDEAQGDGTDLVEAYVHAWNADWQYTLNHRSNAATAPNGVFESAVLGD